MPTDLNLLISCWLLSIMFDPPDYVDHAVRHVMMRQGVLGVTVSIMLPHDPTVSVCAGCTVARMVEDGSRIFS